MRTVRMKNRTGRREKLVFVSILTFGWLAVYCFIAFAATYYVSEGKSIQDAADIVQPGDTVIVRGGIYHEEVVLKNSGTKGNYITFEASPGEEVLLDGSEPLSGWTQCESPQACGNNPNWQNIYYTSIPEGVSPASANLYEDETLLQVAQDPDPPDPLYFKLPDNWMIIPSEGYTNTQIVDPYYFTQSDQSYWNGSYVLVWSGNNNIFFRRVLSYGPDEHRITFDQTCDEQWLEPGKDRYAMWNHLSLIDTPGEYSVDESNHKLYLWPHSINNLDKVTVSTLGSGFFINSQNYVVIDGLKFRRYSNQMNGYHLGVAIRSHSYHRADHIIVRNNEVTQLGLFGYASIYMGGVDNGVVDNNYIHDTPTKGIFVTGTESGRGYVSNNTVSNNRLERVGGTGICFFWTRNSSIINNVNINSTGQHANGITVYLYSHDILIDGNTVINCNNALTMNSVRNITITNNVFKDSANYGFTGLIVVWDGDAENVLIDHNTVLNSLAHAAISVPTNSRNVTISNNIADGILLPNNSTADYTLLHNLYLNLAWNMGLDEMGKGGILETNLGKIFIDYNAGDFRLKPDSVACTMSTTGSYVGALPWPEAEDAEEEGEKEFRELQIGCYNNIFNPTKGEKALIKVELAKESHVKLILYNTRGQKVKELADEEKDAGMPIKYYWDGKDDSGNVVGSGLYFVHIQAGDYKKIKKIVVVK